MKGNNCNKTRAFLILIIRNVSIDIYRRRKRQYSLSYEELEEELPESGQNIEDIIITNETFNRVAAIIKELPPSYADIISLKYYYHYEDEEISQILNITLGNIRTRLHRARQNLIKLLAKEQEVTNNE
ncbi:MAG: RNA polymerase sigma factor [Desulfitobacterium hafniense]|nr:RNA polymerase sigma factor [Desulfitobacterium hafniense]